MQNTYCCSDLHGSYELWDKIKRYCNESDVIYFLGDATDRGKYGIKIIQEMMMDKRVKYIRGNHDQFLINYYYGCKWKDKRHWLKNGGKPTLKAFKKLDKQKQKELVEYLDSTPTIETYKSKQEKFIILSHAGFSPRTMMKEMETLGFLWNREHLKEEKWYGDKDIYLIHGHTPVFLLQDNFPSIGKETYCEGHKIDIDLATYTTRMAILLDLDTLNDIIFAETQVEETLD